MTDTHDDARLSRRGVLGSIGAGTAAALAGCSGLNGGGGASSLDFWMFGGIPAEREYVSSHYDSYDGTDINYSHQEWGQKFQIIASAAANNNLPDVMAGQCQQIPDYVGAGALQPLDQEDYADDLEDINDRFIQANIDTVRYSGLGGEGGERQWALPGGYADLGPFIDIRTDYLEQTSFDRPPRTWDELIQMGEEMQEIDGVSAAITAPGTDFGLTAGYFIGFVYANGGRYYDPETLEATVDQPGFVDAVTLYQRIAEAGLFPDSIAENNHIDAGRLIREGQSGIFITYSHANAVYQTTGAPQEWLDGEGHVVTRAPLPESPSGEFQPQDLLLQNAQGFMMATGANSEAKRDAAFDYIDWWNSQEQLAPWGYGADADVGIRGRVPTLKSAFEDPSDLFESQFGDLLTLYDNNNLFTQTSRFPSFSGIASVQSELNTEVIQPVVLGNKTAEEACSDAKSGIQDIIDENLGES
jgi:ABC-type glycerol-3-phosphate transport system substrate-binding protein